MNFKEWYKNNIMPGTVGYDTAKDSWEACKEEVLKIINETPLGYITESEHEKLEKFADLLEDKIKKL